MSEIVQSIQAVQRFDLKLNIHFSKFQLLVGSVEISSREYYFLKIVQNICGRKVHSVLKNAGQKRFACK